MADSLAIAAATRGFAHAVGEGLIGMERLSAAPEVRVGRPPTHGALVGVNIFMYLLKPSAAHRNADLATRRGDGTPLRRPGAALELQYLVSFHGEEAALEPERIMGAVVARLHAAPTLDAAFVRDALTAAGAAGPLAKARWDASEAPLRAAPLDLDIEATHRLWSLFPQIPYAPSLAYALSTVIVEAGELPAHALPMRHAQVRVSPPKPPPPTVRPPVAEAGALLRITFTGAAGPVGVVFRRADGAAPIHVETVHVETAQAAAGAVALRVPDALSWGRWRIALTLGTGQDAPETEAADLLLVPHLCDGARWRPARAGGDSGDGTGGEVVCRVRPAPPGGPLLLLLHPLPGDVEGASARTARALRATAPLTAADALDAGRAPPSLLAILPAAGAPPDRTWQVELGDIPGEWRLASGEDRVRVSRQTDGLLVEGGLDATDPADALAFHLAEPLAGEHLLRLRPEDDPASASALRLGVRVADFGAADVAALDAARTPDAAADLLRRAGAPVVGALRVSQVVAGDGWSLVDDDGRTRGWARPEPGGAGLYALDVPGGVYFGPSLRASA